MKRWKIAGFTLSELIIAIAIVGVFVAMAYPSYSEHITKARRVDGKIALLDLASKLETYYAQNNTYATATVTNLMGTTQSNEGYYTLGFSDQTATTYTITATPNASQATFDTQCQTLTLDSLGQKGVANGPAGAPTGTAALCW